MILIADSSALVALSIINQLDVLEKIFGEVYVPRAVYNEVRQENKEESKKLEVYCKDRVLDISTAFNFNITLGKVKVKRLYFIKKKMLIFYFVMIKRQRSLLKILELMLLGVWEFCLRLKKRSTLKRLLL
jgi:hypothetical protein